MRTRFRGALCPGLTTCLTVLIGVLWATSLMELASVAAGPATLASDPMQALIDQGRQLFVAEKFAGNGRTCATCHRPEHHFTIDPTFIATLPATDPLFVAESNPVLAGLEDRTLLSNSRSKVCVKYAGPMELWKDAPFTTCEGQSRRGLSHLRLSANTAMLRTACFLCVMGHRELLTGNTD